MWTVVKTFLGTNWLSLLIGGLLVASVLGLYIYIDSIRDYNTKLQTELVETNRKLTEQVELTKTQIETTKRLEERVVIFENVVASYSKATEELSKDREQLKEVIGNAKEEDKNRATSDYIRRVLDGMCDNGANCSN